MAMDALRWCVVVDQEVWHSRHRRRKRNIVLNAAKREVLEILIVEAIKLAIIRCVGIVVLPRFGKRGPSEVVGLRLRECQIGARVERVSHLWRLHHGGARKGLLCSGGGLWGCVAIHAIGVESCLIELGEI